MCNVESPPLSSHSRCSRRLNSRKCPDCPGVSVLSGNSQLVEARLILYPDLTRACTGLKGKATFRVKAEFLEPARKQTRGLNNPKIMLCFLRGGRSILNTYIDLTEAGFFTGEQSILMESVAQAPYLNRSCFETLPSL